MKAIFAIAGLLLVTTAAQARPNTLVMSCADAQALVQTHGAKVLGHGRWLYNRYVVHVGYCQRNERIQPAWVPTADDATCFVGYTCEPRDNR